ncbi:MAG TPA: phosphate acyltransferase PlsX [Thermomicrobiales bacterium]|nr:phosphate acyltransferase PlsX [Thermomicrobiales bacterium]
MPTEPAIIAVDAMGGDHGPTVVVGGAVAAARRFSVGIRLYGDKSALDIALGQHDLAGLHVEPVPTVDTIGMDEHPTQAVRRKPESSLMRSIRAVQDGEAGAMVSAGNSGAVMAGALMNLGRVKGIDRPAIASHMPSKAGRALVLDLGAVTDPKPAHMVQFAIMGQTYARYVLSVPEPTIGLLSNGEEGSKGNQLTVRVHELLQQTPGIDFHGNVEGKDIMLGTTDIVVADGFTGNIALKTAEGTAAFLLDALKSELRASPFRKLGAAMLKPAFREVARRLDYAEIGGAPLLGVDGNTIIAHGRSNALAVENAIGVALRSIEQQLPSRIAERVSEISEQAQTAQEA